MAEVADDRVVPNAELTADQRDAVGWAVSTGHPLGVALVERARSGGTGVTAGELAAIGRGWDAAGRPVPGAHLHRTEVVLDDGTAVIGVTFGGDPYGREAPPAFGLYLDERWDPPWPHAHVDWPDFGLPSDLEGFETALRHLLSRARRGDRVEVGCLGGHGRTGTALACLAVLTGTPASDAVASVRASYCPKAVETDAQEALVAAFPVGAA